MLDTKTIIIKKAIKKKKKSYVINILKKFVEITTITKRILDLNINLTVSKLLILVPAIEQQFIKAILKDKSIQFWVNSLESCEIVKT